MLRRGGCGVVAEGGEDHHGLVLRERLLARAEEPWCRPGAEATGQDAGVHDFAWAVRGDWLGQLAVVDVDLVWGRVREMCSGVEVQESGAARRWKIGRNYRSRAPPQCSRSTTWGRVNFADILGPFILTTIEAACWD